MKVLVFLDAKLRHGRTLVGPHLVKRSCDLRKL
jgi:hypothetical protein